MASLLLGFMVPLLTMAPASAATSCTWQDKNTLSCGGETFSNPQVSGNNITLTGSAANVANDGGTSCPADTFKTTTTGKSGTLVTYTAATTGKFGGNCSQNTTNATLTNTYGSTGATAGAGNTSTPKTCSDGSPADSSGNCPNTSATTCGSGSFDWIECPADWLLQKVAGQLLNFMQSLLYTDTSNNTGIFGQNPNGDAYYRAWNTFRILGTALIVIAGLVMVGAQAFGFEFLDAYTIRKVLPRLFVAIIGMSLSWPLLNFIINFFNVVGQDIQQLMYAPFSTLPNHAAASDALISYTAIGGVIAAVALGYGALLFPILGTGVLALLLAVLVLIIRQIGITLLVIVAPFAIAAYVLPNTKKLWDIWKDNFLGLMFMYPIVMMLIAAGEIFGAVGKSGSYVQQIVGIVAFFAPYFMIPLAFRMATGFISTLSGMVNDRSKGAFDRLRNARSNIGKKRTAALRNGYRFKGGTQKNFRGRVNRALGYAGNINQAGWNPAKMRSNMSGFATRHHLAEAAEMLEKNPAMGLLKGNEDFGYAFMEAHGDEAKMRRLLTGKYGYDGATADQAISQFRNLKTQSSYETLEQAVAMGLSNGTGFKQRDFVATDADGNMIDENGRITTDRDQAMHRMRNTAGQYIDSSGNVVTRDKAAKLQVMGGAQEVNKVVNEVWGSDRLGAAQAKVIMRTSGSQGRRFDYTGNSTGVDLGIMQAQYNYENDIGRGTDAAKITIKDAQGVDQKVDATPENVNKAVIQGALEGQAGNYIAAMRNAGLKTVVPEMIATAEGRLTLDMSDPQNGDANFEKLTHELAANGGRYDGIASSAPENASEVRKLMAKTVTVSPSVLKKFQDRGVPFLRSVPDPKDPSKTKLEPVDTSQPMQMTYWQLQEHARDLPDVQYERRELGRSTAAAAAAFGQQQGMATQVLGGPGGMPGSPLPGPGGTP